ncbi:LPXTG cell wall anchor domain-containing protein [Umezawaea beigongshangensis]|uniref:LPXTG cell wall anchor domain-containing protein n=1 Tax=Umezawaea beigongshangensis TaxID=2780383 RepID=UPI0018F11C40|nr:LPXTG cell wall anchor domain-containing protein [Umezawaea beigongshangensis]
MQFARPQAFEFGRKVLGASAVIATSATALALLAGPASAHTPAFDAKCADGKVKIMIDLKAYTPKGQNKGNFVVVTEGGAKVHDKEFGNSYTPGWIDTDLDPAVAHTITFAVDAHDGKQGTQYDFGQEKKTEACVEQTTPPASSSSTPPVTTTEVSATTSSSSVVPPVETTPASTTESAPVSTTSVSTPPATTTTTSVAVVPVSDEDELASTGASILVPLLAGIGLLGAGAAALFFVRRRNTA